MPFREKVKQLASERGLSVSKLGYLAFDLDMRGTSPDTLNKAMQGKAKLNDALAEAVATVLDVPPQVFVEYRLSQLRQSLDENIVGFRHAALRLELIERVLAAGEARDGEELAREMAQELETLVQTVKGRTEDDASVKPVPHRKRRAS